MKDSSIIQILERMGAERSINYSLDRFKQALTHVGNPEKNVYSFVISGTNGKGTTTLLVSAGLVAAGYRVATYLSPHLQHPRERFLLNLTPISEAELDGLGNELEPVAQEFKLSYFEFLTLINFVWAKRHQVDFLVLEVGLGGRLDATNVTSPLACAVTNISYDHERYLGSTLEEILHEKLGTLPPEGLLFTGIDSPKLLPLVEAKCLELDAIYYYSRELQIEKRNLSWERQSFYINGYPFSINTPMTGARESAALAFLLLRIVFPRIPLETLQRGFAMVRNPGRMEVVQHYPRVVLSGDHNPAGIETLKATWQELGTVPDKILCAFSLDKPYTKMFSELSELGKDVTLTRLSQSPLPADYEAMAPVENDAHAALDKLIQSAHPSETILVTGSLYLLGQLRSRWQSEVEYLLPHDTRPTRLSEELGSILSGLAN